MDVLFLHHIGPLAWLIAASFWLAILSGCLLAKYALRRWLLRRWLRKRLESYEDEDNPQPTSPSAPRSEAGAGKNGG